MESSSDRIIDEIERRAFKALLPPPRQKLSEWIEEHIRLPDVVSALPGRVRLWPYQRGIADAIGDPSIERITLVKSVRVGFTTLLTGAIGSYVSNEPAPILALLPTEADARDYVVSDIEPIFEASPVLRGALFGDTDEAGRNTLLHRRFPGGSLKVVAAKAPRNLRRHTARVLFVDEADAMEPTAEGAAILLAERRTMSFADRKIVVGSTPLHEETSNVLRYYAASDQRVYEVPCPSCDAFTEMLWGHIEWQPDLPETASFRCPACQSLVAERHKAKMVASGRWRATVPEIQGHAGFRVNALISMLANASWASLAAEFLRAKTDTEELKTFVNTILGQGWRDEGDEVSANDLLARVEPFTLNDIPADVLILTIGADVQDDRVEATVVGWGATGDAFILGHHIIWGSAEDDSTWQEVDAFLKTRWHHPLGGMIGIDAAVIDSGGHWTENVYGFCFPRAGRRIMAGKGVSGPRPALQASQAKVKNRSGRLFLVGVDGIKTRILTRLSRGRTIRLSVSLDENYFEQLSSERRIVRYSRGQPTLRFERKVGARAEALDCLVYAFAAHHAVNISVDQRRDELAQLPPVLPVNTRREPSRDWVPDTPRDWF